MATETGLRTQFRRALQTALERHFATEGLAINFEPGAIEGPQERDVGCVWFDMKRLDGRDTNNENALFGVRVFRRFRQEQGAAAVREETEEELERTFEILEDALVANMNLPLLEANAGVQLDGWESFFVVQQVTLNHRGQYIEATLAAWARNRTARGG